MAQKPPKSHNISFCQKYIFFESAKINSRQIWFKSCSAKFNYLLKPPIFFQIEFKNNVPEICTVSLYKVVPITLASKGIFYNAFLSTCQLCWKCCSAINEKFHEPWNSFERNIFDLTIGDEQEKMIHFTFFSIEPLYWKLIIRGIRQNKFPPKIYIFCIRQNKFPPKLYNLDPPKEIPPKCVGFGEWANSPKFLPAKISSLIKVYCLELTP